MSLTLIKFRFKSERTTRILVQTYLYFTRLGPFPFDLDGLPFQRVRHPRHTLDGSPTTKNWTPEPTQRFSAAGSQRRPVATLWPSTDTQSGTGMMS